MRLCSPGAGLAKRCGEEKAGTVTFIVRARHQEARTALETREHRACQRRVDFSFQV